MRGAPGPLDLPQCPLDPAAIGGPSIVLKGTMVLGSIKPLTGQSGKS